MYVFIPGPAVGSRRGIGKPAIWKLLPHVFSLLSCLLLAAQVFPQTGAYTLFRVEERRTEYLIPDSLSGYFMHERALLLPRITRDSLVINVYANSDVKTTTFHQEDNQFESWMTRPAKTINDKKMMRVYNAAGGLILSQLHSAEYKGHLTTLKSHLSSTGADLIPDHVQLTSALRTSLLAEGFVMTNLGAGTFRFVKDSVELFYNNTRKYNQLILKRADGSIRYSIERDFRVNAAGQTVPYLIREQYPDPRFPAGCVMVQQTVTYPHYSRSAGILRTEDPDEVSTAELEIFPNPASDHCMVQLPAHAEEGQLQVFDQFGRLVWQQTTAAAQWYINLPSADWQSGIYTVQWLNGTVRLQTRLIISL